MDFALSLRTAERKKLAGNSEFAVVPRKNLQGNWTLPASGGEHRNVANGTNWLRRQEELLAKLTARAVSCPGLYPFHGAADFLRVAQDHAGTEPAGVCRVLEALWQRPDEAIQLNAQSLIQRGKGWKGALSEDAKKPKRALESEV